MSKVLKKGYYRKKCLICKKDFIGIKRRVTCSSKCSHKWRNSTERINKYK